MIAGGIDLNKDLFDKINSPVFSIFYKNRDNYYCLHNGKIYHEYDQTIDFCENMTSLKDLLPKLDYYIPGEITMHEAINYFNCLFKNQNKLNYNNTEFNIDNFYYGNTDLCLLSKSIDKMKLYNLAETKILSGANLKIGNYKIAKEDESKNYLSFKSIFYKIRGCELYNIYDNQIYLTNYSFNDKNIVKNIEPLKDELRKNNINYHKNYISIPKAKKLIKKIN